MFEMVVKFLLGLAKGKNEPEKVYTPSYWARQAKHYTNTTQTHRHDMTGKEYS